MVEIVREPTRKSAHINFLLLNRGGEGATGNSLIHEAVKSKSLVKENFYQNFEPGHGEKISGCSEN